MADFGRILAAVDAELGTTALDRYASQATDLAADRLASDPLGARMLDLVTFTFEGTSGELLKHVAYADEAKRPKGWPADARAVTGKLHRLAPAFRKAGWTIEDLGRGGHGDQLRWRISPPARPEIARDVASGCPQRPQGGADAGNAGVGGHDIGPSQDDGQEGKPPGCPRHQQTAYGPYLASGVALAAEGSAHARLSAVAFHETFWVAVAAAAPIIALANQVTMTDVLGMGPPVSKALDTNSPGTVHDIARRAYMFAISAYIIGFVNLFVQAFMLISALVCLQSRSNELLPYVAVGMEGLGLLVIGVTAFLSGIARFAHAQLVAEGELNVRRSNPLL